MKGHEARNFVRELLAYGQGQSRKVEILENWYSDEWNEGVTPRNAHTDTPTGISV